MLTVALEARPYALDGFADFMEVGSGTAKLRVLQHLVTLVEFDLAAAPFGAATLDSLVLASAPIAATSVASGRATRVQLINQNGDVGITTDVGPTDSYGFRVPRAGITDATAQSLAALVVRMSPDGRLFLEGSGVFQ
jgi:hypothetical protein